jgi:subtilisin family serine protease
VLILQGALDKLKQLSMKHNILDNKIEIKPASDYMPKRGEEVAVIADFMGEKGAAFTDEPSQYSATVSEILNFDITTNRNRAIVVASINAILRKIKYINNSMPCTQNGALTCAQEMAFRLHKRWSEKLTIGIVGFHKEIAHAVIDKFSSGNVQISDLNYYNIGKEFIGTMILDGYKHTNKVVANNFLALVTGSTLVNDTIDSIIETSKGDNKNRIVIFYGVTIAGVDKLMNLRRLCFQAQ